MVVRKARVYLCLCCKQIYSMREFIIMCLCVNMFVCVCVGV